MPTSPYSLHPSIQMVIDWVQNLPAKTGRSLDEWLAYIRKDGPKDEKACRDWLKNTHDLGTNSAWWLAEKALGNPRTLIEDTPEGYTALAPQYVEEQYMGKKAALRPLYHQLLTLGLKLGNDVKACPCKTMVPFYRDHVFAQLKPATNSRIDLGLALGKLSHTAIAKGGKRLIDTGGKAKKDRITHRIAIEKPEDVDAYVLKWLTTAYDLDAPVVAGFRRAKPMKKKR